jgi:GDPmannose 4,6-dehydratase
MLLTIRPIPGEIYNIGGDKSLTVGGILDYLLSISKYDGEIKVLVDKKRLRPIDADLQIPDTSKFRKHTKWKPKISFQKTLEDLLNYWREKVKKMESLLIDETN